MTPKPSPNQKSKFTSFAEEDYNCLLSAEDAAAEKGLIVVRPGPNQLQIDLDTEAAYIEFKRRLDYFRFDKGFTKQVNPSASGLPHRHVTLTFRDRTFEPWERIALQAALGDDPIRVYLNAKRYDNHQEDPSRLFEKPTQLT